MSVNSKKIFSNGQINDLIAQYQTSAKNTSPKVFVLDLMKQLDWYDSKELLSFKDAIFYSFSSQEKPKILLAVLINQEKTLDDTIDFKGRKLKLSELACSLAWQKNIFWVIVSNFETFQVYYAFIDDPRRTLIVSLTMQDYSINWDILNQFSPTKIDKVESTPNSSIVASKRIEVEIELLREFKHIYNSFLTSLEESNPELPKEKIRIAALRILNRLFLLRVSENRSFIQPNTLWIQLETWDKTAIAKEIRTLYKDLQNIFHDYYSVYRGDFFDLHWIDDLKINNEVLASNIKRLYRFDFSQLSNKTLDTVIDSFFNSILDMDALSIEEDYQEGQKRVETVHNSVKHLLATPLEQIWIQITQDADKKDTVTIKNTFEKKMKDVKLLALSDTGIVLSNSYDEIASFYSKFSIMLKKSTKKGKGLLAFNLSPITDIPLKIVQDNLLCLPKNELFMELSTIPLRLRFLTGIEYKRKEMPSLLPQVILKNDLKPIPEFETQYDGIILNLLGISDARGVLEENLKINLPKLKEKGNFLILAKKEIVASIMSNELPDILVQNLSFELIDNYTLKVNRANE